MPEVGRWIILPAANKRWFVLAEGLNGHLITSAGRFELYIGPWRQPRPDEMESKAGGKLAHLDHWLPIGPSTPTSLGLLVLIAFVQRHRIDNLIIETRNAIRDGWADLIKEGTNILATSKWKSDPYWAGARANSAGAELWRLGDRVRDLEEDRKVPQAYLDRSKGVAQRLSFPTNIDIFDYDAATTWRVETSDGPSSSITVADMRRDEPIPELPDPARGFAGGYLP
jgi:hypothetical protein